MIIAKCKLLFGVLIAVILLLGFGPQSVQAQEQGDDQTAMEQIVVEPVKPFVASPPLPRKAKPPTTLEPYPEGGPEPEGPIPTPTPVDDGIIQSDGEEEGVRLLEIAPPDALSAPAINVAGVTASAFPPDTILDAGPDHIVQMTNNTGYIVFDKQGNPIGGATPNAAIRLMSSLWPAGDVCAQDDTDPIVVYDHLADRWLIAQVIRDPAAPGGGAFNPPGPALCIAISTTPDPTSTWYAYTYDTTDLSGIFPDYEKFGVWPDGYYMSSHEGSNSGVFVFDRVNMLVGAAAGFIKTTISALPPSAGVRNTRILPADLDGPAPPAGTPNFWVRPVDGQQDTGNPTDRIEVYEAVTDWSVPSLTFSLVDTLTPAAFNIMVCDRNGGGGRDCVPQPVGNNTVDALSNRPMMQLKFRNFSGDYRMVFNQTINVQGSLQSALGFPIADEVAGIRWYELRKNGPNWTIEQQGTYSPQPIGVSTEAELLHRWMGSIAMDNFGSMALGYSIVNSDAANPIHPGISYSGRRFDDIPGSLTQIEQSILVGVDSQAGQGARWGDYSAMTVDPVDDCTFWYTQHVADLAGGGGKPTQIASFRFSYCAADLEIFKYASPDPVLAGEQLYYDITVVNHGPIDAANVQVVDTLPPGVTYVTDTDACVEAPAGTLTCDLGDIANGDSVSFTVKVAVDPDLVANAGGPTTITNTAVVSYDNDRPDLDESNNEVSLMTIVEDKADLEVTKLCKPDGPLLAGETGECTVFVDNLGPSEARNVVLTDTHLSDGSFTFGAIASSQGSCSESGGVVTCGLGDLPAASPTEPGRATVTIEVTANEAMDINNVADAVSDTTDPDSSNNQAEGSISVTAVADLGLTKSDSPDPVIAGNELTYTLEVTNYGPSTAVNVLISDILPAGVSIISAVGSGGAACNAGVPGDDSQPTTCAFDSMAFGATETMTVTVDVLPQTTGLLHNDARVFSETFDDVNENDLVTEDTTVNAEADLTITKTDSPDPVLAGGLLTYIIDISNSGPSTAMDVTLTDTLPPEVSFVGTVEPAGSLCELVNPGTVSCTLGNIDPGSTATVFIEVQVDASVPDGTTIFNTAELSSATSDPSAASVTEDTLVNAEADLWIDKTGSFPTGNPSRTIIYYLTVHNREGCSEDDPQVCGFGGPSDAQDVVVVDTLPLTRKKAIVDFTSENCSYSRMTHTVTCTEPVLQAGSSVTFEIQIDVKGRADAITNVADVTSSTADPDIGNNHDELLMVVKGGTGRRKK